ncbi:unnamed protein product [Dovyalis caffra]|uniref:Peptidase A1 domain-containing protein n=1 Tax=Dovyalis caffra TaxID=77055 RepID=A0AAV1SEV4_9ROSI|nr:unnamed protein product [Dovyalis caffra]
MTSSVHHFLALCSIILFFISPSIAQKSFRPKALFLPVSKDSSSLQYITHVNQRTPLVSQKLVVDLGGQYLWVDCEQAGHVSSSYRRARCGSIQCKLVKSINCINNGTCTVSPDNTVTGTYDIAELGEDVVSIRYSNGYNPGREASGRKFLFGCAPTHLLEDLARGVKGMAGLGRNKVSLPSQFSAAFSFHKKFAICLSSSNQANGGSIFFGNGPYFMLPNNIDISKSLTYTPLIINPVSTAINYNAGEPSSEYFIGVKSIKINGNPVKLNSTLLSINKEGYGGTKISTVHRYTVLETSIYNSVVKAFVQAMANISEVVQHG